MARRANARARAGGRPGLLDRALGAVGLQRRTAAPRQRAAYAAAAVNRLVADWIMAPITSANREIQGDLQRLRARSREQARNNGLMKRWLRYSARQVVGREIRLRAQVMLPDGTLDYEVNAVLERHWRRWARSRMASADGRNTLHGLARRGIIARRRDGDALFLILRGAPNPYGLALQELDADQLDHTFERAPSVAGDGTRINEIRLGVEVDERLQPVAYWLWQHHPTDWGSPNVRVRVPAADVIHLFAGERAGQVRGVPEAHATLLDLKMLGGYKEAELVAARAAAAKMGFFKVNPQAIEELEDDEPLTREDLPTEAEPGTYGVLPPGYEYQAHDPQHPTQAFGDFVKANKRDVATGFDVNYATFCGDLEAVNYSSGKLGLADERDMWAIEQEDLALDFYDRVFREWVPMALLTGALPLPVDLRAELQEAASWQPRGWQSPDALKDAQADALGVSMGRTTLRALAARDGGDYEENLRDLAEDLELAADYGVPIALTPLSTVLTQAAAAASAAAAGTSPTTGTAGDSHGRPS